MDKSVICKYPRTPHLEGSRLQPGDEDLSQIPFEAIKDRHLAVEEKCDGANSAVSFDGNGRLLLQSRGHYLTGGYRERHFNLFKQWAAAHSDELWNILGTRYIMYGEWMYAKHTVFYDALPHYFLEFDIFDRETGIFLDTPSRHRMLEGSCIVSVPVLKEGEFSSKKELLKLITTSNYITGKQEQNLCMSAVRLGLDQERACGESDMSGLMEGLYIKVEENGQVTERMKYVRHAFLQQILSSNGHWIDKPIIPNQLGVPVSCLFE